MADAKTKAEVLKLVADLVCFDNYPDVRALLEQCAADYRVLAKWEDLIPLPKLTPEPETTTH